VTNGLARKLSSNLRSLFFIRGEFYREPDCLQHRKQAGQRMIIVFWKHFIHALSELLWGWAFQRGLLPWVSDRAAAFLFYRTWV